MGENNILVKEISKYLKENPSIDTTFGRIKKLSCIGQGGSSIVYKGTLEEGIKEICIKFFLKLESESDRNRFKAEYFKIQQLKDGGKFHLVNLIHYEVLSIKDWEIPIILMTYYPKNLAKVKLEWDRSVNKQLIKDGFNKLLNFLLDSLEYIHSQNIIHRDLKPQNILIDEIGDFILADFGIAKYDNVKDLGICTKKGDRLANVNFSAPEQFNGSTIDYTADIYAMGQILYWYMNGETLKGQVSGALAEDSLINEFINKCLQQKSVDRFQNIMEIRSFFKEKKKSIRQYKEKQVRVEFNSLIRKIVPSAYQDLKYVVKVDLWMELIVSVSELIRKNYNLKQGNVWYSTGHMSNPVYKIELTPENHIIIYDSEIEYMEYKLNGIWLYVDNYAKPDLFIFDLSSCPKFEFSNHTDIVRVNVNDGQYYITSKEYECGTFERDGNRIAVSDKLSVAYRYEEDVFLAIGEQFSKVILPIGDEKLIELNNYNRTEVNDYKVKKIFDI